MDSKTFDLAHLHLSGTSRAIQKKKKRRSFRDVHIVPLVAQWLKQNYDEDPDGSLPKDDIYQRYLQVCYDNSITPSKNNIFSKMLKKIFPQIRSRRLGPRGRGIPHYGGITPRNPNSTSSSSGSCVTTTNLIDVASLCTPTNNKTQQQQPPLTRAKALMQQQQLKNNKLEKNLRTDTKMHRERSNCLRPLLPRHHYNNNNEKSSSSSSVRRVAPSSPPASGCKDCEASAITSYIKEFEERVLFPRYLSRCCDGASRLQHAWPEKPNRSPQTGTGCLHEAMFEVLTLITHGLDLVWQICQDEKTEEKGREVATEELVHLRQQLEVRYGPVAAVVREKGWAAGGLVHVWLVSTLAAIQYATGQQALAVQTALLGLKVLEEWQLNAHDFTLGPGSLAVLEPLAVLLAEPDSQLYLIHLVTLLQQESPLSPVFAPHLRRFVSKWHVLLYQL